LTAKYFMPDGQLKQRATPSPDEWFLIYLFTCGAGTRKKNPPVKWYVNTVQVNGHMAALNWAKLTFRLNWNEARTQLVSLVTQRWTHQSFPVLLTFCLFLPIWCAFGSATMLTSGNGNLKWEILNDKRQSVLYPKNIRIQNFSVLWSHCLETQKAVLYKPTPFIMQMNRQNVSD